MKIYMSYVRFIFSFMDIYGLFRKISIRKRWKTCERVASANRQRTKQSSPRSMEKTINNTPVLLPISVNLRRGARSACVTAIEM